MMFFKLIHQHLFNSVINSELVNNMIFFLRLYSGACNGEEILQ